MAPSPQALVGKVRANVTKVRKNGLAGDASWGLIIEVSQLVLSLATFSMLGRSLGTNGYGHYASLYAVIVPLGTLAAAGVALAFMQHALREGEDLSTVVRSCLSITLGIGAILTIIGVALASWVVPSVSLIAIGSIALVEFVSAPIGQIAAAAVLVRVSYARAAQVRLIPIVARGVILVLLFAFGHLSIASLGVTYLLVSAAISVITVRLTSQRFGISGMPGRIDFRHLRSSATYSVGITGLSLQNDGDKMVLAINKFERDTGLYSAAYRIVQFGLLPVSTLTASSHQRFLQHTEGHRDQHLKRALRFASVTAAYGVVFALVIVAIAPFLPILMGADFKESVPIVRWLAPLVVLRGLAMFPLNGLMGLGKTFLRSALLVASAVFSMIMYIVLIPSHSWKGAAIGTVAGEAALAIAAWWLLIVHQKRANSVAETADLVRRARLARRDAAGSGNPVSTPEDLLSIG